LAAAEADTHAVATTPDAAAEASSAQRSVAASQTVAEAPSQPSLARPSLRDASSPSGEANSAGRINVKSPTLGGRMFWTDELIYRDWRVQRHCEEGHCRLIDGDEVRQTWGTFDECKASLEAVKREQKLPPLSGRVVLVLHGLGRSRWSNESMVEYLNEHSKFTVLSFGYASTHGDVAAHAHALASVIENLGPDVTEIDFVAHSLGNLVVRHYLADHTDPATERRPDPRIRRIVMVGPPNRGALMAVIFGRNSLFERVVGLSGRALARGWNDLEKHLAVPSCEFGIIAGGELDDDGYNPLLPGDDDLIVSVDETKLPGARDFMVVHELHAKLMRNAQVHQAALSFLQHGYFTSEQARHPLPATTQRASQ
jgi:pimeloyl-ACP methyl ester carboxylesterase